MRRFDFRTQLTLTIAMVVFVTVALISLLSNEFINKEFERYAEEQQEVQASDIAENLSHQYDGAAGGWDEEYVHGVGMAALYNGYIIRLVDSRGGVVWDAENHDMEACRQVMADIISRMEEKRPELSGDFVTREYGLEHGGQKIGTLAVQYYGPYFLSESDFGFLDSLNIVLAVIGGLALLSSLAVGGLLAKQISRPVIKTAHIATQIAEGNYRIRFDGKIRIIELNELVTAVNHMAASLENQEGLRRRLTTDVAHELRTPLTAVASHLEAMIVGLWETTPQRLQSCYEEIGRISGLVADLEQLAQVESDNFHLEKSDIDLLGLARTVAYNFETESAKKGIAVSVGGEEAHVNADKGRMTQVLSNLLSNAIKYTPENGRIQMTVKDTGGSGVVAVEDDGIGIPEKDLPFIFERFYRTDESRNRATGGAGIGLAIAKSIAAAHGGSIAAESDGSKGSRFTVTLPK